MCSECEFLMVGNILNHNKKTLRQAIRLICQFCVLPFLLHLNSFVIMVILIFQIGETFDTFFIVIMSLVSLIR